MSGEARISEREAVMRERAAFIVGACDTTFATRDGARDDAERRYPLPKVERPRVDRVGFIGWIGSGYNSLGRFPATLTELNDAMREYAAADPGVSS